MMNLCITSCGLCCDQKLLCETCVYNTLRANGFEATQGNRDRIKNLIHRNKSSFDPTGCSQVAGELRKMVKEYEAAAPEEKP